MNSSPLADESPDSAPDKEQTAAKLLALGRERIPIFSPGMVGPEITKKIFVAREALRDRILEDVRASAEGSADVRNTLLLAGRGGGKSTLVQIVYYAVRDDHDLYSSLRVAWQIEDEMDITSWQTWIVRILRALATEYKSDAGPLNAIADRLRSMRDRDAAESEGEEALRNFVGDRGLFLLVENMDFLLDGILGDQGEEGLEHFRQFFESLPKSIVLATSPAFDPEKFDSLAGFFHQESLEELKIEKAQELLIKIARDIDGDMQLFEQLRKPETLGRLKVVRELAGGSPRVWVLFGDAISLKRLDLLTGLFRDMVDRVTPLYQERLRNLPAQERRIVTFLVDAGGAVPVKEIADACRLEQPACAALLARLVEKSYVERASETVPDSAGDRRKVFYELREPLMRFCLQGKESRGEPLSLIVEFLSLWFGQDALEERLKQLGANENSTEYRALSAAVQHAKSTSNASATSEAVFAFAESNESNNTERALKDYDEALRIDPRKVDVWKSRCDSLNYLHRYDEALASCDEALKIDARFAPAWSSRGDSLNYLHRYEEALASCDEALKIDARFAPAWSSRGDSLNYLHRYEEALASCDEALKIDARFAPAWSSRGDSLNYLHRYEEALASCDEALKIDARFAPAWSIRGDSLNYLHRYEEALASCDEALKIDARFAPAWSIRGDSLSYLNRYEEALTNCDEALKIDPNYVDAWSGRGDALNYLHRFEEALQVCDRALRIDPKYVHAWNGRGNSLIGLRRYEEALASYDEALRIDAKFDFIWSNRGNCLNDLRRYEEALASYDEALRIDPNYDNAWSGRGGSLSGLRRYEEAVISYDESLRIDAQSAYTWYGRGVTFEKSGLGADWKKHLVIAHTVVSGSTRLPVAAAAFVGRRDAAVALLDEAVKTERRYESGLGAAAFFLIQAWLRESETRQQWPERVRALTRLFAEAPPREGTVLGEDSWGWEAYERVDSETAGLLPRLSNALTTSLGSLFTEEITPDIADAWFTAWESAAGGYAEMQIALRLLRVAVQWKRTRDRGVLLRLPKEERSVLEELLKEALKATEL